MPWASGAPAGPKRSDETTIWLGLNPLSRRIFTGITPLLLRLTFDTTSIRFDWVLGVKGVLVGLLVAGAYLHDFVLGPGLARQIREGKPQSLRPILTTIGRANLLVTLALPVLGGLLSEFLRD